MERWCSLSRHNRSVNSKTETRIMSISNTEKDYVELIICEVGLLENSHFHYRHLAKDYFFAYIGIVKMLFNTKLISILGKF